MQRFKGEVGGIKVQVVDTTGAGDAFCAGLLSLIVKDPAIIDVSTWSSQHTFAFGQDDELTSKVHTSDDSSGGIA